ncbi:MAG: hypothetical protein HRU03_09515 [Nanoarchaeales archaeon]|nr:hypothetical protein [Nanoarchaeales archaeon]
MKNLSKVKEFIRESQGVYGKEKIESELVDNFGTITTEEFNSIYDKVIESKEKVDLGNKLFFLMIFLFIFGIPFISSLLGFVLIPLFGYILYLGHKAKSIDKDNTSARNLLIGTYVIIGFMVGAVLLVKFL